MPATTPDGVMGPTIHQALATRDLLPSMHLLDGGYANAELLVTAQTRHQIDVVGPPFGSSSRQRRTDQGYDLRAFVIEWEAQQARCPKGHASVKWTWDGMAPGLPSCASALTGRPVGRVRPVRRAPGPKTLLVNSPSGRKPTTRRFTPRGNARTPPRSQPSMPGGPGSRARTHRASAAVGYAELGISDWPRRICSNCSPQWPSMWSG